MAPSLLRRMADELQSLDYRGVVVFCGFGEPLLYPHLSEVIGYFGTGIRVEIVTNGDRLTAKYIEDLIKAGTDYMVISMYDGPHQIEHFQRMFRDAGYDDRYYLLRDRWHTEEDNFGLKLTNRAGTVSIGKQDAVDVDHPCHYPAYSMTIDWNGDVLLCVQDWNKKVKLGNLYAQSMIEAWRGNLIQKYRHQLADGGRRLPPCNRCNTDGTLHGFNHVAKWRKAWGKG
jgi:radical SAM protein with 4Fe4S-binding SPASM domain